MKSKIAIYLAGSIKKGHENPNESFWTDEDINLLKKRLSLYEVTFLNPALRSDDLSDQRSVFGRDMLQVFCSDKIVENLAEGAQWIGEIIFSPSSVKIKGIEDINGAMEYYKDHQLHKDLPMKKLSISGDELSQRMHRIHPRFVEA